MPKKAKIAWDISHQEFTVKDHYYYSVLDSRIREAGGGVNEIRSIKDIIDYDVLVINYPEKSFTKYETDLLIRFVEKGKRIVVCGYYNNEDKIADNVNSVSSRFGLTLRKDCVREETDNYRGDNLFLVTSKVFSFAADVKKVLLPCCASIKIDGNLARGIVLTEGSFGDSRNETVLAAQSTLGEGSFILIGTCVFWDNYSIRRFSNLRFSLNLLLGS